ncbi:substrate-binding domain-containing protein [Brucellaceae bacterium C25G]
MSKPTRMPISAQRVAERAGVSRSAVSRTFTEGASVSETTRAKVLKAAEELGYHVNHLARGLIRHQSGIVCLIIAEIKTPYQASFLEAATRHLQAIGKVVMVINTAAEQYAIENALRQTLNYRADATVVVSGSPSRSLVETCINNGQRVIIINRDDLPEGTEKIMVDNKAAAEQALLMLQRAGCKDLTVVSSTAGTASILSREQTFIEAAEQAGLSVNISRAGPTGYATGVEAARQLLASPKRPDGVFCVTDLLALGFMDSAKREFSLNIPQDLCIIGFDDIPQASWQSYELTTFRQPLEEIAQAIASSLRDNSRLPAQAKFPLQTIWRRSVRP